jgi:SIR2-like domain
MTDARPRAASLDAEEFETHYDSVITGFARGRVTPVLGAGVNLCGRTPHDWFGRRPPSSAELAHYLSAQFKYPPDRPPDLLRVSQYIYAVRGGSGPLYDALHDVFDHDFPTTAVHDFLAALPAALRDRQMGHKPPLIVTTNYDDLMEAAFAARNEPFDLIVFNAEGPFEGQLCSRQADGTMAPIRDPATNVDFDPDKRAVILKIHGFVDRVGGSGENDDSYVITEDHYIEYLGRMDLNDIPVKVLERLRNCHFLFLGAGLSDWNLRASLYRLWSERRRDRDWWAIQVSPDELERRSWRRRGVEIYDIPLDCYIAGLSKRFAETRPKRT